MCIFSFEVQTVESTRIFARATGRGSQFLAYQMSYSSTRSCAMILPVPISQPPREDRLRFINLESYERFFDDLADGFPFTPPSFGIGCAANFESKLADLAVFQVGSYVASFVPALADFNRLDAQFRLPDEIWRSLPQYENFGFAVFQLSDGEHRPHPMAFEFESANSDVFFPTMHIHDGKIHSKEEFDHVLYVQHAGLDSRTGAYRNADIEDSATHWVRSKFVAEKFCKTEQSLGLVDPRLLIHRKIVKGILPNEDLVYAIDGDPVVPERRLPWLLRFSPALIVLGGIAAFLRRRARMKKRLVQ